MYFEEIRSWAQKLRAVNMNFVIICGAPTSLKDVIENRTPTHAACLAFESLRRSMNEAKHAVFRGNVYRKTPGGMLNCFSFTK